MHRFLGSLLLSITLMTPVAMRADDDHHKIKRYYDKDARDWHEWNEQEEHAYRRYLQEKRRDYHDWGRAKREEQRDYWRWRHEHRENVLPPR